MKNIRTQIDELFYKLQYCSTELNDWETRAAKEIEATRSKYKVHVDQIKNDINNYEKQLYRLSKKNKKALFPEAEPESTRIDFKHGALIYSVIKRAKRIKGMLKKLKKSKIGKSAIKIAESVNWDEIDKWSDEKLEEFGTERIKKENIEYELKQ